MLWASWTYARWLALIGLVPLVLGGVLGLRLDGDPRCDNNRMTRRIGSHCPNRTPD